MGCFSWKCSICHEGVNSSSFCGEHCVIYLLKDGRIIEEMAGQYNSYGACFNGEHKKERMGLFTRDYEDSHKWAEDWSVIVDMDFGKRLNTGICIVHGECLSKYPHFVPHVRSDRDPDQGWNDYKYSMEGETYHKVY